MVICGQGEGEGKKEGSYAVKVRAKGKVKSVTSLTLWQEKIRITVYGQKIIINKIMHTDS